MRVILASIWLLAFAPFSVAQVGSFSQSFSESEARQHIVDNADPVYPPVARAARIQGDVVMAVVIEIDGSVATEKVLSGPAMLQQAALDAVKKWHFAPFQVAGVATRASATLTIPFHIDKPGEGPSAE
jgi:TonB family protein